MRKALQSQSIFTLNQKMAERAAIAGPLHVMLYFTLCTTARDLPDLRYLPLWLISFSAVLRLGLYFALKPAFCDSRTQLAWRVGFGISSLVLALAWSMGAVQFFDVSGLSHDTMLMVIALFGIAALSVPSFAFDLPLLLVFLQILVLPMTYEIGAAGGPHAIPFAVSLLLFDVFISFLAVNLNRFQIRSMRQLEEISELHGTMNAMVDSLREAFLLIGPDGRVRMTESVRARELFGGDVSGRSLLDLLKMGKDQAKPLTDWLHLCFEGRVPFDTLAELGPSEFVDAGRERILRLRYRALRDSIGAVQSIVLVVEDVSAEKKAQREAQANVARAEMLLAAFDSPTGLRDNLIFTERVLTDMSRFAYADLDELRRDLHTLKGGAGMFRLDALVEQIDEVERQLAGSCRPGEIPAIGRRLLESFERWKERESVLLAMLGSLNEKSISVPMQHLLELNRAFQNGVSLAEVRALCERLLLSWDLGDYLRTFNAAVSRAGRLLGKSVHFDVRREDGEALRLPLGEPPEVLRGLIHLLNNSVDHGLERPSLRQAAGKPLQGRIWIRYGRTRDANDRAMVRLMISDDGAGINVERLKEKVQSKTGRNVSGLLDFEVWQLIFDQGISTKEVATTLSGQGVGMAAVRAAVEKCGGRIRVSRSNAQGTEIEILLPEQAFRTNEVGGQVAA